MNLSLAERLCRPITRLGQGKNTGRYPAKTLRTRHQRRRTRPRSQSTPARAQTLRRACRTRLPLAHHAPSSRQFKSKPFEGFEKTDAFRRPERFQTALNVCVADKQGRLNLEDAPYPQREHWLALLEAANQVDAGKIAAECRAQGKAPFNCRTNRSCTLGAN